MGTEYPGGMAWHDTTPYLYLQYTLPIPPARTRLSFHLYYLSGIASWGGQGTANHNPYLSPGTGSDNLTLTLLSLTEVFLYLLPIPPSLELYMLALDHLMNRLGGTTIDPPIWHGCGWHETTNLPLPINLCVSYIPVHPYIDLVSLYHRNECT